MRAQWIQSTTLSTLHITSNVEDSLWMSSQLTILKLNIQYQIRLRRKNFSGTRFSCTLEPGYFIMYSLLTNGNFNIWQIYHFPKVYPKTTVSATDHSCLACWPSARRYSLVYLKNSEIVWWGKRTYLERNVLGLEFCLHHI